MMPRKNDWRVSATRDRIFVDDLRVGRLFRMTRIRAELRQVDVAARARVSQAVVSAIELGRCDEVTLPAIRRVGKALGIRVELDARPPAGDSAMLLDRDHAGIVEATAERLRSLDWQVIPEFTFNHFGDRGSVDLLGWHEPTGTLLIVEAKTRLLDVQDLLASQDRKHRVVPMLVRRDHQWDVVRLCRLLVVERTTANRRVIAAHRATLGAAFPDDARRVITFLRRPDRSFSSIWLRSFSPYTTPTQLRQRVRAPRPPR
jgi:transcriptional regulator with XRE-family HTH domain